MDNFEILQREITETKYLSTENTYRYRPIMRFFYHKYEQAQNWLYKEEIYEYLKNEIPGYELEDLERDLTTLVDNKSLTTVQDVKNIHTLEDFKNKRFRYQMTDYAIAIERMTIDLEEMEVKIASLSPRRFEVLKQLIGEISGIDDKTLEEFSDLFNRLTNEFKDLNQNYQDFLKKFQESKTEELLESTVFLEYKDKMIAYLRDFIQGYLTNANAIKTIIINLNPDIEEKVIQKLEAYQRETPKIYPDFNYEKFNEMNRGRWHSFINWFVNKEDKSEGERMMEITNSIITQITKCAASLVELHGNMIARKEEYKHLCKLFDSKIDVKDSHKLSSVIFGITNVTHYKGTSTLNSDSLVSSYEVPPTTIEVEPHEKKNRRQNSYVTIVSKTEAKKKLLAQQKEKDEKEKALLQKLLQQRQINLTGQVKLSKEERNYILNLISRGTKRINKENLLGLTYKIEPSSNKCEIISQDGTFYLDGLIITFEKGDTHE